MKGRSRSSASSSGASSVARDLDVASSGPDEASVDRRLRAELDNLRAARDAALVHGRRELRFELTVALDEAVVWRDLHEVWGWATEAAGDPSLVSSPMRADVLGCAAEAARLTGDLALATRLADEAFAAADGSPERAYRAWRVRGSVAHFRGDFAGARDAWLRACETDPPIAGALLGSAALAAAYDGEPVVARELLDRAHATNEHSGSRAQAAFAAYVEGELLAGTDDEAAIPYYLRAIEGARAVGTTFVEGVASVALAAARTRSGDVARAASGFVDLIDLWRGTGQETQLWTTARNAARLLAGAGRTETAALLLVCAEQQPGAASVEDPESGSGRTSLTPGDVLPADEVPAAVASALDLGTSGVLDRARGELVELTGLSPAAPRGR